MIHAIRREQSAVTGNSAGHCCMDEYTLTTKVGLARRFALCDDGGIYYAFQPIYGYNKGHSEPACSRGTREPMRSCRCCHI